MGYDKDKSEALSWEESQEYQEHIQDYAVQQGINLYKKFKDEFKKEDDLKWGEEVEYHICTLNHEKKAAQIDIEGHEKAMELLDDDDFEHYDFDKEFGSWMIETNPKTPFSKYDVNGPRKALDSLIDRRKRANSKLQSVGDFLLTLSSFPTLGNGNFFATKNKDLYSIKNCEEHNKVSKSKYVLDELIQDD